MKVKDLIKRLEALDPEATIATDIGITLDVKKSTLYNYIRHSGIKFKQYNNGKIIYIETKKN